MNLISEKEVLEAIDRLMIEWPYSWRTDPNKRLALDTLHDAAQALKAFEDAARTRAAWDAQTLKRATDMAEAICLSSLRRNGAL